jgi:hypothetical protein
MMTDPSINFSIPNTTFETMEVLELNQNDIRALLDLIEFHDDWDEASEMLGTDVAKLYDKVAALRTY